MGDFGCLELCLHWIKELDSDLVGAPVTQLAVAVMAPAVEVAALGEGEDVRPRAVGEPDHLLVAERLHLFRRQSAMHISQS